MTYLFIAAWLCLGVCVSSLFNAYGRSEYRVLYIDEYFGSTIQTEYFRPLDAFMFVFYTVFGPIGFITIAIMYAIGLYEYRGMSLRLTKWSREEARELFPDDYCWEQRYRKM